MTFNTKDSLIVTNPATNLAITVHHGTMLYGTGTIEYSFSHLSPLLRACQPI
ncbi:hypothetical protein SAMD00023353_1401000 [Rosellinia necatrix]|uniref:Uncharacterized protein n=1 Tax=Rosellinia necatrix TaxID=77044 RepID=A0A1S8A6X4_ROSNE|nr:hypothetical protein SAMD00023353_1401000 [Rosellinia necatrix]